MSLLDGKLELQRSFLKIFLSLEKFTYYGRTNMPDFWPSYEVICQFIKHCSAPRLQGIKNVCVHLFEFSGVLGFTLTFDSFPFDLICLS